MPTSLTRVPMRLTRMSAVLLVPLFVGTTALCAQAQEAPVKTHGTSMKRATASEESGKNWSAEYKVGADIVDLLDKTDFSNEETQTSSGMARLKRAAEGAETHLRTALALARQSQAKEVDIANILVKLVRSLSWQERYSEAKTMLLTAKEIREKHCSKWSVEVAECLMGLIGVAQQEHQNELAEDLALDAYDIYMKLLPRNDARFCDVLPVIGAYTRDRKEAAEYYNQFVDAAEKRYGKTGKNVLLPMVLSGASFANNHQHAEAAKMYQRALTLYKLYPNAGQPSPLDNMRIQIEIATGKALYHDCKDDEPNDPGRRTLRLAGKLKSTSDMIAAQPARDKYGIHDNKGMDDTLKRAETLLAAHDFEAAKKEWMKVLDFMNEPGWFPTAMMVPIVRRFATLADSCMRIQKYDDVMALLYGALNFPFHSANDDTLVDDVVETWAKHVIASKTNVEACRVLLTEALAKVDAKRQEKYQKWLNELPPRR